MTNEEFLAGVRRKEAELNAHYEVINQTWPDSGIPVFVLQTPDWQSGWRAFLDWLKPHHNRTFGLKSWDPDYLPNSGTTWVDRVHIFSHWCSLERGHSKEQAALEEEGQRAILAWWNERAGTDGAAPTP